MWCWPPWGRGDIPRWGREWICSAKTPTFDCALVDKLISSMSSPSHRGATYRGIVNSCCYCSRLTLILVDGAKIAWVLGVASLFRLPVALITMKLSEYRRTCIISIQCISVESRTTRVNLSHSNFVNTSWKMKIFIYCDLELYQREIRISRNLVDSMLWTCWYQWRLEIWHSNIKRIEIHSILIICQGNILV